MYLSSFKSAKRTQGSVKNTVCYPLCLKTQNEQIFTFYARYYTWTFCNKQLLPSTDKSGFPSNICAVVSRQRALTDDIIITLKSILNRLEELVTTVQTNRKSYDRLPLIQNNTNIRKAKMAC